MLDLTEGILFHQVNCQGVMGGGIAFALAEKYPGLEKAYRKFCKEHSDGSTSSLLGRFFVYKVNDKLYIVNVFGQDNISTRRRQTSYDATVVAFENFVVGRKENYGTLIPISLPYYFPYNMGCGLGGGNWSIYSAIIDELFPLAVICQYYP